MGCRYGFPHVHVRPAASGGGSQWQRQGLPGVVQPAAGVGHHPGAERCCALQQHVQCRAPPCPADRPASVLAPVPARLPSGTQVMTYGVECDDEALTARQAELGVAAVIFDEVDIVMGRRTLPAA